LLPQNINLIQAAASIQKHTQYHHDDLWVEVRNDLKWYVQEVPKEKEQGTLLYTTCTTYNTN